MSRRLTRPRLSLAPDNHNDDSRARLRVPAPECFDLVERLREMRNRGLTLADLVSQWEGTGKDNGKRSRAGWTTRKEAGRVPADKAPDVSNVSILPLVPNTQIKPALVRRRQAAELLNCGYRAIDELIKRKELISKKIGWRVMVTRSSLEAWMGEEVNLDQRPLRRDSKAAQMAGD